MPFSLKYIPKWNALEIKGNGKNSPQAYSKYMQFMSGIPEAVQPDDYTHIIPRKYITSFLKEFGFITTMTQTVGSITGGEASHLPEITYEAKHLDTFKLEPFPFQKIGISFLVSVKRGIIGDEMGLGKTPMGLGAAHELIQEGLAKKILIVPPASLKYQWENEIAKFTDYQALVIDGTAAKRKKQYTAFAMSDIPFCIAGYETVRGDIESIKAMDFDCVILDEGHRLRNRKTQLYQAIIQLQPEYRFALTGTPMQNRPDEIYALMSWIDPNALGKVTAFTKEHVVMGEKFGRKYVPLGYKNLDTIRDKISQKMLRRLKSEVAPDLPDMIYSTVYADMTKAQKTLYDAIQEDFKLLQMEIQDFYQMQSDEDARKGAKTEAEDQILGYMYMMQAVSGHPLLLAQGKSKMAKKYMPLIRECRTSPKLDELMESMTPILERGSKIVIFSQYTQMLQLMKERIMREFDQEPYMIYGAVSMKTRQEQMDDFEQNPQRQIMLMSDAGNAGWNIAFADTLYHYDSSWNPAVNAQRAARIHRINSTFDSVNIVSMVTNGTIDEQVQRTLLKKLELSDGLVERTDDEKELMREMLDLL